MTTTSNYTTSDPPTARKPTKTRIACYERVSTEEQTHGYSIAAQKDALTAYCISHDFTIIGHYTDEGISGGKPASKRPAMARLLRDIEHGLIDCVLFCKLDRWFRNVKEYFKTQEILEAHGVTWNAIQEDYETETAAGRMTVTIMLSVAQNERERTSERIRSVFEYRAARGEYLVGGQAVPYGYKLVDKHLVKDPDAQEAVERLFHLVTTGTPPYHAAKTVKAEYKVPKAVTTLSRLVRSPVYAGIQHGTPGGCPAYITEAQHEAILTAKGTRAPKSIERIYLFTGLLHCPVCGYKLIVSRTTAHGTDYVYYMCKRALHGDCTFSPRLTEKRLECVLTAFLIKGGEIVVDEVRTASTVHTASPSVSEIEKRMRRLAETYTDGLIDRDAYKTKLADLTAQFDAVRNAPKTLSNPPLELARQIVTGNFTDVYNRLSRHGKRQFWASALTSITVDENYVISSAVFNER